MTRDEAIKGYVIPALKRTWTEKIVDKVLEVLDYEKSDVNYPPQQKIGRWIIIVDDCKHFIAKCSECGKVEDSRMISKYPYCHCGAKMVGVTESEE